VFQSGVPPQARYLFKHALVQDTAYQSLLKSRRQQLHQQVAQVLVDQFSRTVETQPELVAYHYTEAGLVAQAIPYWQQAGQRATQHSAHTEAISHLTKGLELLKTVPDTAERAQQELTLLRTLGVSLSATKGFGAAEVEKTYTRARELCQQLGASPQLFPVLFGLWTFYAVRAKFQTAHEIGTQLLSLAQRQQDTSFRLEAHLALGNTLTILGEFAPALQHFEQGIAIYNPQQHSSHAFLYGEDPGVVCLSYAAHALWYLGYPDQALERSHRAITLSREVSHPFSLAYALGPATLLCWLRKEVQAVQERAEALITLCSEHGFAYRLIWGKLLRHWALAEQGQVAESIVQMQQHLTAYQEIGAENWRPLFLALLAEAYGKGGQVEEGLTTLTEALAVVNKTGEHIVEAELYRLRGEFMLARSSIQSLASRVQKEAEASFLKAIDIARAQQAKSWELRAATSLARLWQQQGKQQEAHQLLAAVYDWFTEGFDTKDLQEAKALLDELAGDA
jgi:predicted ATPase